MKICPRCNGARRIKLPQGRWDKLLRNPADTEACHFCHGIGEVAESAEEEQQRLARQGEFQRTHTWAQRSTEPEKRTTAAAEELVSEPSGDLLVAKDLQKLLLMLQISTRSMRDLERGDNEYYRKIKLIGEDLIKDGGFARMQRVGHLVNTLGGSFYFLKHVWTGFGQWPPSVKRNPRDGQAYVWIPPGSFQMGHEYDTVIYTAEDERPVHSVSITRGFWMGQTPVTWHAFKEMTERDQMLRRLFEEVRKKNYSPDNAVTYITWDEARQYSEIVGMRLPTEAEWEWASRGSMPNLKVGLDYRSTKVGRQMPNGYGLHDMLGSVLQWVSDWYGPYESEPQTDPQGPSSGDCRVVRGGSRMSSTRYKSALAAREEDIGFRCVCESL